MVTCKSGESSDTSVSAVFTRESLSGDETPSQFAKAQQEVLSKQLPEFVLHHESVAEFEGRRIPIQIFGWSAEGTPLTQLQGFVAAADKTVWIVTLSSSSEDYDDVFPLLKEILVSFRPAEDQGTVLL